MTATWESGEAIRSSFTEAWSWTYDQECDVWRGVVEDGSDFAAEAWVDHFAQVRIAVSRDPLIGASVALSRGAGWPHEAPVMVYSEIGDTMREAARRALHRSAIFWMYGFEHDS